LQAPFKEMSSSWLRVSLFIKGANNETASDINEILRFNIGGYTFDTTRSTIKTFGGPFLNTLIRSI
jgi:hypothetical protein